MLSMAEEQLVGSAARDEHVEDAGECASGIPTDERVRARREALRAVGSKLLTRMDERVAVIDGHRQIGDEPSGCYHWNSSSACEADRVRCTRARSRPA